MEHNAKQGYLKNNIKEIQKFEAILVVVVIVLTRKREELCREKMSYYVHRHVTNP